MYFWVEMKKLKKTIVSRVCIGGSLCNLRMSSRLGTLKVGEYHVCLTA